MSQRKPGAGLEVKRGVGNLEAGSGEMAGELGELKRRLNSAAFISERLWLYPAKN